MNIIMEAKQIFDTEISALTKMKQALDETFITIVEMLVSCRGKIVITGVGKPGHIAKKIAATLSSLGTPAIYMHPVEALHGDLGMLTDKDIVIIISFSGESEETTNILQNIKIIGSKIISITGNKESTLAKYSDIVQILPKFEEACYMKLAPTSSTTVELVYGDALAIAAAKKYGFTKQDFAKYHPSGILGKRLRVKVKDIMAEEEDNAVIHENSDLTDAIVELSKKGLGIVSIIDTKQRLKGIITDGDLRRLLEKKADVYNLDLKNVMIKNPITIAENELAVNAFDIFKKNTISCLPVIDEKKNLVGTLNLNKLFDAKIVL